VIGEKPEVVIEDGLVTITVDLTTLDNSQDRPDYYSGITG